MKKIKSTEEHFREYQIWVTEHSRFPMVKDKDTFSDGLNIFRWRRNHLSVVNDFESEMRLIFAEFRDPEIDKEIYDRLTMPRSDGDPETLNEYFKGNNRYLYFDIYVYERLMTYAWESIDLIPYLKLIKKVMKLQRPTWKRFHQYFNIHTFTHQIDEALNELPCKYANILRHRCGIPGYDYSMPVQLAKKYHLSSDYIKQYEAEAISQLYDNGTMFKIGKISTTNPDSCHNVYGHWFLIELEVDNKVEPALIRKYPEECLEEMLEELEYVSNGTDQDYDVISTKTYIMNSWEIEDSLFDSLDIPEDILMSNTMYKYTIVRIRKTVKPPYEEYLREYLEELRLQAIRAHHEAKRKKHEAYMKQREKEMEAREAEIRDRVKRASEEAVRRSTKEYRDAVELFNYAFTDKCGEIFRSLHMDVCCKWIEKFNKEIDGFSIPYDCHQDAANVIGFFLNKYFVAYRITCVFKRIDFSYSTISLKRA